MSAEPTPQPEPRRKEWPRRYNWRLALVELVSSGIAIGLIIWLLPGIRSQFDVGALDLLWMAVVYGLLNAFVQPLLHLLLMPFVVQTYGFALIVEDVGVFALLLWIVGPFEVNGILPVVIGGILLGLLRIILTGLLGLTPPVLPNYPGRPVAKAPRGLRKLSSSAADGMRLLRIRRTIVEHTLDAAFGGDGPAARLRRRLQSWIWKPPEPPASLAPAMRFRLLLQDLGPTYVKVGQIISSRGSDLPAEWEEELEKLQSEVAPFPYEHARARIVEELGSPPEELYAEFDPVPMAAASLAQVHRARLHDGRDVTVKVQRPNIHSQLRSDVRILVRTSQALERRTFWARDLDLSEVLLQFGTTLLRELDYTVEAYNARRLSQVLETVDGVRVPDVVYELSSSGVLTLEFIRGVKSTDGPAIDAAGLDREVLAENTIRAAVKMYMIDGFFHADPHPGNVFVDLGTGDMTMLDTGMVGELTVQQRIKLGNLFLVIRNGDVTGLAQALKSLSTPHGETDDDQYYREFERTLTPYLDPPPGQRMEVAAKVLPKSMEVLSNAGYRLDPDYTIAIKSVTQAEAITAALVPAWGGSEFMRRAFDAMFDMLPDVMTKENIESALIRQASYATREIVEELPSLRLGAAKWITNLKRGGITVELDTSGLDRQLESLQRIAVMVTLGILVVGLVVGSAIAAGVGTGEDSVLAPVADFAAFVFVATSAAGVVALVVMTWRLLRRDRRSRRDPLDRI